MGFVFSVTLRTEILSRNEYSVRKEVQSLHLSFKVFQPTK